MLFSGLSSVIGTTLSIISRSIKTFKYFGRFVAYVYEDICKNQYLPELIIKNAFGFTPTKIGKWWDRKDTEIDIVATDNSNNIIFGECKYTKKPLDVNVYYDLLEKAKKVNWNKQNRNEYFVFFCINGYTEKMQNLAKENSNIVLY